MDLFSLVARLTLDEKDYEKALKQAERKAGSAKVDVSGEINVSDHFSDALNRVQSAADHFDGNVSGDITANDQYTGKVEAAETKADEADLGANGILSATDSYSEDLTGAENKADNADLNANGDLTATDDYSGILQNAEDAATYAALNADGTLSASDGYTGALEEAEGYASTAALDAGGTLDAQDLYTGELNEAENEAGGAQLDAHGLITGDSSDFTTEIDTAKTAAENFETDFQSIMSRLESALKFGGIAVGISSITKAISGSLQDTAAYADTVDKSAQAMGIARSEYQKWDYVMQQNGASIESLKRRFGSFAKFLKREADSDFTDAMSKLGISPTTYKTTEELFENVLMFLAEMGDVPERSVLVDKIFGPNGKTLNAMLNTGKAGIQELMDEAERLGMVLSDEEIATAVAYGDAVSKMNRTIEGLKMRVTTALMPFLQKAADIIAELVPALEKGIETGDFGEFQVKFSEGFGELLGMIGDAFLPDWLKSTLTSIADFISGIVSLVSEIASQIVGGKSLGAYISEYGFLEGLKAWTQSGDMTVEEYKKLKADVEKENQYQESLAWLSTPEAEKLRETNAAAAGIDTSDLDAVWKEFLKTHPTATYADVSGDYTNYPEEKRTITKGIGRSKETFEYTYKVNYVVTWNGKKFEFGGEEEFLNWLKPKALPVFGGGAMTAMPDGNNAKGLWDVPYDDYAALLHRDEMVLTASQARDYREGSSDSDTMMDLIQLLRTDMANLKIQVGEKVFGQTVVDYSGRKMRGYIGRAEDRVISGYGWG